MALKLTEKAAGEVKRIMTEQKMPQTAVLRVGVRGGGCSGFEYALGFDQAADEFGRHRDRLLRRAGETRFRV